MIGVELKARHLYKVCNADEADKKLENRSTSCLLSTQNHHTPQTQRKGRACDVCLSYSQQAVIAARCLFMRSF